MEGKIEGVILDGSVLVWSSEDVDMLRSSWRILGGLIGALPQNPRQNIVFGPPIALMPEEVCLLLDKGILEVYKSKTMTGGVAMKEEGKVGTRDQQGLACLEKSGVLGRITPCSELKVAVFHDLWDNGYYLTSALKYGGDYLVYHGNPSATHSSHIAVVLPWKQPIKNLVSLCRVGTKVKKNILLCSAEEKQVCYYTLTWARLGPLESGSQRTGF